MFKNHILGSLLALGMLVGCGATVQDQPETSPALGVSSSALTQQCVIGCPSGYHPVQYYCGNCGGFCSASYDSTICDPNTGFSFQKCDYGGCPSGYHATSYTCNQNCVGSSGTICGGGMQNATNCQIDPPIISNGGVVPDGASAFHPGTTISIYGSNFVPNGSNVYVTQNGTYWYLYNSAWWWNGNSTQINATLPSNLSANGYATVQVNTGSGYSNVQYIYINP